MPGRMVINTESTTGYDNKLKQAIPGMKLGVNNEVNPATKKVGIQHMEGGPSKINRPNSHPSNPIHKAAMAAQEPKPASKTQRPEIETTDPEIEGNVSDETPQHEINKTAVIIGVFGLGALLFIAFR